jgi:hypothetical protein
MGNHEPKRTARIQIVLADKKLFNSGLKTGREVKDK